MHSNELQCNIYQILLNNLQNLDSIWVVIAQMFRMLQPIIQHLVKRKFLLLWMNQNIQGIPACNVLLSMFV